MEYILIGKCALTLKHNEGEKTSSHVHTDILLEISINVPKENFIDKNDLPTKEGCKALTQTFIQGLVANIHNSHQKNYWDSAEHLRYIIKELERGFIQLAKVDKSIFPG